MKQIVWVNGHSGAGKETFCKYIADNPDPKLIDQLGWKDYKIGLIESSIQLVSRGKNDKTQQKRDAILAELKDKANQVDVAIIKYQSIDKDTKKVEKIYKLFPNVVHRALVIETSPEEIKKRLLKRAKNNKWDPWDDWDHFFDYEQKNMTKELRKFKEVTYINADGEYNLKT